MKRAFSLIMVCLLCLSMFSIFAPKIGASNSLVGYWNFDEGSGSVAHDSAGTNDGVIRGVPSWTTGIVGGALRFDGEQNNYVAMSSQLGVTDAMTVEAWVYPEFDPTNPAAYPPGDCGRQIIRKSSCGDDAFFLGFYSGYYFNQANPVPYISAGFFYQGGGGANIEPVWIPGLISQGNWYHLVATFKRNDYLRLYVNGVEEKAVPTEDQPLRVSSRHLTIGQEADVVGGDPLDTPSDPQTWIGKIDEVKICDYAKSADQIAQNYQSFAGPVGYWKFDEGSGNVAHDSSGNGNGGIIYTATWVEGGIGKALEFNGIDSYVSIPDSSSLDIDGNQISVEFWVKFDNPIDGSSPYVKFYDKGNTYNSAMLETGRIRFTFWVAGDSSANLDSSRTSWLASTWYHIAEIYDGNAMKIYVDGVLDSTKAQTGNIEGSSYPLALGAYTLGGLYFLQGAMDEVKIYNYARTPQQIQEDKLMMTLVYSSDWNQNKDAYWGNAPNSDGHFWQWKDSEGTYSEPSLEAGNLVFHMPRNVIGYTSKLWTSATYSFGKFVTEFKMTRSNNPFFSGRFPQGLVGAFFLYHGLDYTFDHEEIDVEWGYRQETDHTVHGTIWDHGGSPGQNPSDQQIATLDFPLDDGQYHTCEIVYLPHLVQLSIDGQTIYSSCIQLDPPVHFYTGQVMNPSWLVKEGAIPNEDYYLRVKRTEIYQLNPTETATAVGKATIVPDFGTIQDVTAVSETTLPTKGKPKQAFPYGFFSFKVTDLTPGQTVTVTIAFPSKVPVGTQYWKCQNGVWYQVSILKVKDNVMTISLTDGGTGDADKTANGVIIDPGGLGVPLGTPVGGEWVPITLQALSPMNTLQLVTPWITLASLTMVALTSFVYVRRKKKQQN